MASRAAASSPRPIEPHAAAKSDSESCARHRGGRSGWFGGTVGGRDGGQVRDARRGGGRGGDSWGGGARRPRHGPCPGASPRPGRRRRAARGTARAPPSPSPARKRPARSRHARLLGEVGRACGSWRPETLRVRRRLKTASSPPCRPPPHPPPPRSRHGPQSHLDPFSHQRPPHRSARLRAPALWPYRWSQAARRQPPSAATTMRSQSSL